MEFLEKREGWFLAPQRSGNTPALSAIPVGFLVKKTHFLIFNYLFIYFFLLFGKTLT